MLIVDIVRPAGEVRSIKVAIFGITAAILADLRVFHSLRCQHAPNRPHRLTRVETGGGSAGWSEGLGVSIRHHPRGISMSDPEPQLINPEPRILDPTDSNPEGPELAPVPFEFGESEELILSGLAGKMRLVGLFILGIGLFIFAYGVVRIINTQTQQSGEVGYIFAGLLDFVVGIWTFGAGTEFKKIAETPNKDTELLMRGLENLLRLYTLVYWLCLLAILFTFIQVSAISFGELPV
jgi:hypothetical protein